MNSAKRAAIDAAQAAYDTAVKGGDFTARRHALADLIRVKTASRPPVDANGQPLPDPEPDDTDPGGSSMPTAA